MSISKKGDAEPIGYKLPYACSECGNSNIDELMIIADAPWVVECMECGHPNDARWEYGLVYDIDW